MAYQSPTEGQRVNIKSNSNSVIDNGTVTLQEGTAVTLSQLGNTITFTRSAQYLEAYMALNQSANLASGDHIKFDTVISSAGSNITLDTSTPYTNSSGAASVGRFTLAANHTYWLFGNLTSVIYNSTSDMTSYGWAKATGGTAIGSGSYNTAPAKDNTSKNLIQSPAVAIITTGGSSELVELRITGVTGTITKIGDTSATPVVYGAVATIWMVG